MTLLQECIRNLWKQLKSSTKLSLKVKCHLRRQVATTIPQVTMVMYVSTSNFPTTSYPRRWLRPSLRYHFNISCSIRTSIINNNNNTNNNNNNTNNNNNNNNSNNNNNNNNNNTSYFHYRAILPLSTYCFNSPSTTTTKHSNISNPICRYPMPAHWACPLLLHNSSPVPRYTPAMTTWVISTCRPPITAIRGGCDSPVSIDCPGKR